MKIHIFSTSFPPPPSYLPPVHRSQTLVFSEWHTCQMQNYFEFIGSIRSSDHISSLSILKLLPFTQNWPRKILLQPCRLIFFNHYITAKDVRECMSARACERKKEWIKACLVFRVLSMRVNVPSWLLFQVCWGHARVAAPSHGFRARTPRSSSETRHSAQ